MIPLQETGLPSSPLAAAPAPDSTAGEALQRVVKVRRDYNTWVATETMEDYALRFTPRSARKWSELRVANTAFGAASFLVLEAVGATLLVDYGVSNAVLAILATGLIIFLAGWPISVYAARHGVDMDLLTRGAGFGYIGSTLTSLIYASFTFIFFALEAAVMAYALELAFDIPTTWGYLICALVVIPLVTHGVTVISRLQVWTQPLWIAMLVVPYAVVLTQEPGLLQGFAQYGGERGTGPGFGWLPFGAALTVGIALITQMGEQADYLRFMPERQSTHRLRWWTSVLIGGPGWVIPGVLKMLGGALLAYLALQHAVPADRAVDPNQMYLVAWGYVFPKVGWAVAAVAVFVIVSQLKINVTNAYAGSLAWSNFFSRVTHSHPGRVVWMVFNTVIALMLMELNVFQALGKVLGLYSNLAIAWMMAVVADLVVNKPLGLSPPGIEFKRAHLYDINPVGVGAMAAASVLSVIAYVGWLGPMAQAWSAMIALVTAFVTAPLIAWATQGRYYLAPSTARPVIAIQPVPLYAGRPLQQRLYRCTVCSGDFEAEDSTHCPAYQGTICSLCCSLDARCHDLCKPDARFAVQWRAALARLLPRRWLPALDTELGHYGLAMGLVVPLLALLFVMIYHQQLGALLPLESTVAASDAAALREALALGYVKAFAALLVVTGVVVWWFVLTHQSRKVAQEESNRQTALLVHEIESHRRTDEQLQDAKVQAERAQAQAEAANQAKSRYISAISHELRTPLNGILGYAQLMDEDATLPAVHRHAVGVVRRGGDHLLSLIEGTLDIARIEAGKLTLDVAPMRFADALHQMVGLFELQAAAKGLRFTAELHGIPEAVRADEKRLRQILFNVLGNAIKFTQRGHVLLRVRYAREIAMFEIEDTGPGIAAADLDRIFEPFARAQHTPHAVVSGTGLGLTISKMLTSLMGGEMTVSSQTEPGAGQGTTFQLRLFLPQVAASAVAQTARRSIVGYAGERSRVLVVDNEETDRALMLRRLAPLGFDVTPVASGDAALALLRGLPPAQRPHAICMDLAMPGLDGWATVRALRDQGLSNAPVAIVSANAFDQGLANDVGITAADFILKPVKLDELLDWLGARLDLDWQTAAPRAEALVTALQAPSPAALHTLREVVDSGHVRAIHRALDGLEADAPDSAAWFAALRRLVRAFQLDAASALIEQAGAAHLGAPHPHSPATAAGAPHAT